MPKIKLNRTEKNPNQKYGPGPKQHTGARRVAPPRSAALTGIKELPCLPGYNDYTGHLKYKYSWAELFIPLNLVHSKIASK
jgi:hypothetical protein